MSVTGASLQERDCGKCAVPGGNPSQRCIDSYQPDEVGAGKSGSAKQPTAMLQVVRLRIASMMADVPGVGMTRVRRRLALTSRVRYSASVRRARLKRRLQYRGMTGQRQGPPGVTGGAGGLLSSAIVTVAQNHERGYIWRRDPRYAIRTCCHYSGTKGHSSLRCCIGLPWRNMFTPTRTAGTAQTTQPTL